MSNESLESLKKSLKGDIVLPGDPDYPTAIARWAKNAARNAKVVVYVKDAEDVTLALKYAKNNKLPLAVKSGGHSASGASSSENGLVIDLSRHLNVVKIDPKRKTVTAGGGSIWGDIDKEAIKHGLATVAGTVYHACVFVCARLTSY
jgi:FAD/FMN-containing dehydrogenase